MTLKPKMGRAESSFDCLTLQSIFLLHWQQDLLYGTVMIAGVEDRAGHLTGKAIGLGTWGPTTGIFPIALRLLPKTPLDY